MYIIVSFSLGNCSFVAFSQRQSCRMWYHRVPEQTGKLPWNWPHKYDLDEVSWASLSVSNVDIVWLNRQETPVFELLQKLPFCSGRLLSKSPVLSCRWHIYTYPFIHGYLPCDWKVLEKDTSYNHICMQLRAVLLKFFLCILKADE